MVRYIPSSVQLIELLEYLLQPCHTVGILVVLGDQFQVLTDFRHLVEQQECLLITLTDILKVL